MSTEHYNRMGSAPEQSGAWQAQMGQCMHKFEDSVRENPMGVTMAAFGLGVGVGVALSVMLAPAAQSRHQHLANSLGSRMLDSLKDVMPDSFQQYLRS